MAAAAASFFLLQLRHESVIKSQRSGFLKLYNQYKHKIGLMLGHEIGLSGTEQNVRLGTVQTRSCSAAADVHVTLQNGTVHFHFCVHMSSTGQWRSLLSIVTIGGPPRQMEVSFACKASGILEKLSRPHTETLCALRKRHEDRDAPVVHLVRIKRRTHSSLMAPVFKGTGGPKIGSHPQGLIYTRPRALVKLKYRSLQSVHSRVE